MKKKILIPIGILALLLVLFVPLPKGVCEDGGTRVYEALTYKIVKWNRITGYSAYRKTKVYFFSDKSKSLDELWADEANKAEHSFIGTVLEMNGSLVVVQPEGNCAERLSSDKISFSSADLANINAKVGSVVKITYRGLIMESYPAQIDAVAWDLSDDLRHLNYEGEWLDRSTSEKQNNAKIENIIITKIYADCFFAEYAIPLPYQVKINGSLSDEWCVGDQVSCTCNDVYYDYDNARIEADMIEVEPSDWEPDPNVDYKPVIYLYPEKETEVSVKLDLDGQLTCTYPAYRDGWTVTASPDGRLTDNKGQIYNYLYWEGETYAKYDLSTGFCIRGEDTAEFLEDALAGLGLNRREANEFIVYWLPLMEKNPYNIISFQTDAYTDAAQLTVSPTPDTMIRVFMAFEKSDNFVKIKAQELTALPRDGFTVVEWGGTEIKASK